MLPAAARIRRSQEFGLVVRKGRRTGRSRLVMHVLRPETAARTRTDSPVRSTGTAEDAAVRTTGTESQSTTAASGRKQSFEIAPTREPQEQARVGFVVSKAVGNAVVRHRVARRLRHIMRERLPWLPAGTLVVVRALPRAASATSDELAGDADAALAKLRMPVSPAAEPADGERASMGST